MRQRVRLRSNNLNMPLKSEGQGTQFTDLDPRRVVSMYSSWDDLFGPDFGKKINKREIQGKPFALTARVMKV